MTRVIGSLMGFLGDRANPMVVKEVRQGTRSRIFLAFFALLLLGSMIFAAVSPSMLDRELQAGTAGAGLFAYLLGCLVIIGCGAVPWMAFRAVVSEREQNTWELLAVSGMSPFRVISGKINSALLQLVVFYSAVVPFLAMSFLLRGIDMQTILVLTTWTFIISVTATATGVFLAALARTNLLAVFLQVVLICALVALVIGLIAMLVEDIVNEMMIFASQEDAYWLMNLGLGIIAASCVLLLLAMSISLLTFEGANRSTLPRLAFMLCCAVWLGWCLAAQLTFPGSDEGLILWVVVPIILSPFVYLAGLFACTEQDDMSRRQRNALRSWHVLVYPFLPGPGRGWVWFLGMVTATAFVPALVYHAGVHSSYHMRFFDRDLYYVPLWLGMFNVVYVGIGTGLWRLIVGIRGRYNRTIARWVLTLLAVAALLLPVMAWLIAEQADPGGEFSEWLVITTPLLAVPQRLDGHFDLSGIMTFLLVVFGLIALVLQVPNSLHDLIEIPFPGTRRRG